MNGVLSTGRFVALPKSSARAVRPGVVVVRAQKVVGMGMMGTKAGMTTFFTASGEALPCTVIALEDGNVVSQVSINYIYKWIREMASPSEIECFSPFLCTSGLKSLPFVFEPSLFLTLFAFSDLMCASGGL